MFVQEVEAEEKEDIKAEYPKRLLDYKAFIFLHVILMLMLTWASTGKMDSFRIWHYCGKKNELENRYLLRIRY